MATSTVTDWDEIEADPDFSSLPQESRVRMFDDWEKSFNRTLLENADLDKVKPEGLNRFAATNAVRRRKLAGEDVSDPDAAAKTWAEQKQAEAKLAQQALKDYADVEDKAFRLDDARSMPGVDEFGRASPEWEEGVSKASQNLEAAESKFTPEVREQAKAANEALKGERKIATLQGNIYTDPALVLNKDEFRQQVLDSDASPEAKALKLASFQSERKRFANEALRTLRVVGESPIPGAQDFPSWEASQPKEVYRLPPEDKALQYLREMQKRGDIRKLTSAIGTGVLQGGVDIATQAVGTAAMLTGDEEKSKIAAELSRASGDIGAAQELEGDMQATGGTFAGGVARLGTGMAPMLLPGGAVGGIARLAGAGAGAATAAAVGASALTAGAQTAGSQFGEVYDHLRRQGSTHEQAFGVSRNAAVLSGAVTTALTALGGATGVESLLRQGGKDLVKSRLLSALKAVPGGAAAEIAEELPDEYISQLVSAFAKDPNVSPSQVTDEFAANAPDLMLQIAALGGAGAGVGRFRETTTDPAKAREAEFPTAGAPPPLKPQDYENRAAGGQPIFNEEGDVIGVAPPGATPEETAAYREEIRSAAEAAKAAIPEVVEPIDGVDPAITEEMDARLAAGKASGLAGQTLAELERQKAAQGAPVAEAPAPKRPLANLTDEELEQRIQDSSRLANETAVEGSPDAAFFTNAAEKYRAEKARRVAATTQAATPAPTAPVELPVPTVAPTVEIPISDSPSPNLPPMAESSVEPMPARNGRDTSARDAWNEKYGNMRKRGRTHNNDGSPYQPTVFDEVAPQIMSARQGMTDEEATAAIGDSSEVSIATSIKTLINAGWTWSAQERMVPPPGSDPNETPLEAILRLQSGSKTPAPVAEAPAPTAETLGVTPPPAPTLETPEGAARNADMLRQAQARLAGTEQGPRIGFLQPSEVAPATEAPPITPQGAAPTTATEGQPMPGGSSEAEWTPTVNAPAAFTARNGQKLVGTVQSIKDGKAVVSFLWNGNENTQTVPVSQLARPVASLTEPPKYQYTQEQNTRKMGKHFPTAPGVYTNYDFRKAFASMAKDTSLSRIYRMLAKVMSKMPAFANMDLHVVADGDVRYAGEYSFSNGRSAIAVNLRQVGRGKVDALGTILHEALHHLTLAKVRNPQSAWEDEIIDKLDTIRGRVLEYAQQNGLGKRFDYELDTVEEFISAVFTRPDFQNFLASIPDSFAPGVAVGKFRSVLSEIFRRLAELVTGEMVAKGSTMEQAMTTVLALFETPHRVVETGKLEALNAARSGAGTAKSVADDAMDAEYMAAVEADDVAKQQAMVGAAYSKFVRNTVMLGDKFYPATFIRFGAPPTNAEGEQVGSTGFNGGVSEKGISVIGVWHDPVRGKYVIPTGSEQAVAGVSDMVIQSRPVFVVSGSVSENVGSDTEPLMETGTVKLGRQLDYSDLLEENNPDFTLDGEQYDSGEAGTRNAYTGGPERWWKSKGMPLPSLKNITYKDGKPVPLSERFNPEDNRITFSIRAVSPAMDAEYMAAVEAGDVAKQQVMVNEAAKAAGYDGGIVWHGDRNEEFVDNYSPFTEPKIPFFTTPSKKSASWYGNPRSYYSKKSKVAGISDIFNAASALGITKDKSDPYYEFWPEIKKYSEYDGVNDNDLVYIPSIREELVKRGFTRVRVLDQLENQEITADIFIDSPSQIKSADPITRDKQGNVISLSQRFNPKSNSTLYSLAEEPERQLEGANMGRAMEMLGASLYAKNVSGTIGKEVFQNAVDAVMKNENGKARTIWYGQPDANHFVVADTGTGMNPDIIVDKFLRAFVSGKDVGAGGGFGLAKLAFLGSPRKFRIISVGTSTDGRKVKTTLQGTGKSFLHFNEHPPRIRFQPDTDITLAPGFTMRFSYEDAQALPTGTAMEFDMDEPWNAASAISGGMEYVEGVQSSGIKKGTTDLGYGNKATGDELLREMGYSSARSDESMAATLSSSKPYTVLHSFSTPSADVDVIVREGAKIKKTRFSYVPVLNRSIFQFSTSFNLNNEVALPEGLVVNIKPKVRAGTADYPFTTNRESVTDSVKREIERFFQEAGARENAKLNAKYANAIDSAAPIPGTGKVLLDTASTLPPALLDELTNSASVQRALGDVTKIQDAVLKMLGRKFGPKFQRAKFAGLITGARAYGVHFGKPGSLEPTAIYHDIWKEMAMAEEEFSVLHENDPAVKDLGVDDQMRLMYDTFLTKVTGVAFHEALHQDVNSEGEPLARELTFKAGDIVDAVVSLLNNTHTQDEINTTINDLLNQKRRIDTYEDSQAASEFVTAQGGYDGYAMAERGQAQGSREGSGKTGARVGTAPFSPADNSEPFYSKLAQVVEQKMPNRADAQTIKGIINNTQTGIKAEEIKWSGIVPWLESQTGPITKQAVLDYLASDGAVRLEEVRGGVQDKGARSQAKLNDVALSKFGKYYGDLSDEEASQVEEEVPLETYTSPTKFAQYQLPGGENYREVVLAMPFAETPVFRKVFQLWRNGSVISQGDETAANRWRSQGETDIRESQALNQETRAKAEYTSSHFPDVPNYVAHMRMNDRTDAEGKPGAFIEEIQSDRHQAGREKGYVGDVSDDRLAQMESEHRRLDGLLRGSFDEIKNAGGYALLNGQRLELADKIIAARDAKSRGVPDAPFRTTWPLQMFKRALADAVAAGKQWIGWTTGETQAERYDLSKQISSLEVRRDGDRYILNAYDIDGNDAVQDKGVPRNELADVVGKDLANKIISDFETNDAKREELRLGMEAARRGMNTGTEAEQEAAYDRYKTLQKERNALDAPEEATYEGDNLKVGGEGMKGFYDTILPKEIGKYVKQWGAGVVKGSMGSKSPWNLVTDTNPDGQIVLFDTTTNRYVADWDKGTTTARSEYAAIFSRPAASSIIAATQSNKPTPIWRVDITPQMKAGVRSGQTLFSPADESDQRESDAVFGVMMEDDRFEEGVKMYDKAKRRQLGSPPQPSANTSTPPRFTNSAQFAAAFEAAYLRGDFDYFLEALKKADRHIYVPEMKRYINASKLGDKDAAERLEWFRHAIAGTIPANVKSQTKTPPQPQPSAGAPPVGMPPPPPAATPPPKAGVSNRPMLTLNTAAMGMIAKMLGANVRINTLLRRARGRIKLSMADGSEIELSKQLFKDPVQAAKTLAHEIGHLFDFLPASGFNKSLAHKLAPLGDFRKVFGNDLADWFMDGGKKIKPSKITQLIKSELVTLSKKWRGDFSPSDKYRGSGKELYADFISAILNDPMWTAKNAPYATLGFLNALEQKPEVDQAYQLVVSLVQGGSLYKALAEANRGKSTTALERLIAKSSALMRTKKVFKDAARGLYRSMFGSWLPTAIRDGGIWKSYWKRLKNMGTSGDYNWAQEEASQFAVRQIAQFDNDMAKAVGIPLKLAGIDPDYLQRLQTNNRIIHERRRVGKLIEEDPVKARQLLKWMVDAGLLGKDVQDEVDATPDDGLYKKTAEVIYKLHASGDGFERALKAARRKGAPADAEKALYAFDVSGFMLNPDVFTMESAEADNADIEKTLGPDQFGELERINEGYHDLIKRTMVQAYKLGLFRQSTWDDVIVPNFGVYVPFMPIKYFTGYVKGGVGPSRVGTANDLMAPHVVGIRKMHALINRMQRQKQALLLIDFFNNTGLHNELEPVEDENFDRQKAEELVKQSKNTISFMPYWDQGEYKWLKINGTDAVPLMMNSDPDDLAAVYQLLKANTRLWRMNFTIFSIAFNVANTLRNVVTPFVDVGPKAGYKAAKQLLSIFPQMGKWVWAKMAGRDMTSIVAASISIEHAMHKPGMPVSAELQEFYDRGILQPSPDVASLRMTQEELARSVMGALSSPELLLHGGHKAAKDLNWFDKTLKQYFYSAVDVLSFIGSVSEAAPKIAAYRALKEKKDSKGKPAFTDAQATYLATLEGIPRPGVGGSDNALWEMVLLFFRIMGQSWRKHLIMATAPQTRAGFLMRHMLFQGAKFGLQAMAANGVVDYLIALGAAAAAGGDDDDIEKYKQVDWAEAVSRQSDHKLSRGGVGPLICWVLPDGSIEPPYGHKSIPADWVPIMPRLPGTEFSRELDPMSYYATSKTIAPTIAPVNDDVFWNDYMRGLVSLNPAFDVVSDAMSIVGPTPPRDSYRGREKVEQRVWDEGYIARMLGLGEHHLRSFGIGSNPYDTPLPGAWNVLKKPGIKTLLSSDNMVGVREERRARREDDLTSSFAQNMVGEKFGTLKNTFNRLKGKATPRTKQEEEIYNILKPVMSKQFYGTEKSDGMYDVLQSYARMKAQGLQDTPGGKLLKAEADQAVKDLEQTADELQKPLEYIRTHTLP